MNILTQSIAITDTMLNFGNFLTKNAITFDQKEMEGKKRYLVGMKFCCASNAAIKNVKIARKKINCFPKIFSTKSPLSKKIQIFRRDKVYFQIPEVLLIILTTYFLFRWYESTISNIVLNSRKIMKIMSTLYFETPLTAKSCPPIKKKKFCHTVSNYFLGEIPNAQ